MTYFGNFTTQFIITSDKFPKLVSMCADATANEDHHIYELMGKLKLPKNWYYTGFSMDSNKIVIFNLTICCVPTQEAMDAFESIMLDTERQVVYVNYDEQPPEKKPFLRIVK